MREQVIARATNGETFTHAQIKEMIERAPHTTFYAGLVVEGDKVRSKTEGEDKRRKNDTCDPNHSDHITTEIGRRLTEHRHGS
jgi:hypothetical protein